jgi:Methyltransferase domain
MEAVDFGRFRTTGALVYYDEFLSRLHGVLQPRTYFEVGVRDGHSLGLSGCRSIGVDPAFAVNTELRAPTSLLRTTSDEYFASLGDDSPFGDLPIDFAFIDGMHLVEFAIRDFANVERHSHEASVIVFDDVLPRNIDEAAREIHTIEWTGDIYKVTAILASLRPDLVLTIVDTLPTGLLVVCKLDPQSQVIVDNMDEIVQAHVTPDPQYVPSTVLGRTAAVAPETALALPIWEELREARAALSVEPGV